MRPRLFLLLLIGLLTAACTGAPPSSPSSAQAGSPAASTAAPVASASQTSTPPATTPDATALVRVGAGLPTEVASVPMNRKASSFLGSTFHVFGVVASPTSTVVIWSVTNPSTRLPVSSHLDPYQDFQNIPVLTVGDTKYRLVRYRNLANTDKTKALRGLSSTTSNYTNTEARPSWTVYPPLPAGTASVTLTSPLFTKPLSVPVTAPAAPPTGTEQLPIEGQVTYLNLVDAKDSETTPIIVTIHGVRRVPNGTALYFSVAFPTDAEAKESAVYKYGGDMLVNFATGGFEDGFGLLDRSSMRAYNPLAAEDRTILGTHWEDLTDGARNGPAAVGYAVMPALPASVTHVDVIVGGTAIIQNLAVRDGELAPTSTEKVPQLGSGWPHLAYQPDEVDEAMAKRSTAKLIDSITTRSVTKGDGNLDLDANVLFAFDKATLTAKAKTVLAAAADEIRKSAPTRPVKIAGHTDNVGGTAYNQDLSLRRAKAVAAALRKLLPDVTFTVSGRGELDPIANNATAEGRALNRRVTITLPG